MQIGESTNDSVSVSQDAYVEVPVPSGETWKFTFVGQSSGEFPANKPLQVGLKTAEGGNHIIVQGSNKVPPVGGNSGISAKSITVDGDVHSGLVVSQGTYSDATVYYAATRVS